MPKADAAFVEQELNSLNDIEVARVIALGASEAEVLEARAWLDGDEAVTRTLGRPSSGVVEQILAIAGKAVDEEEADEP